jgi:hypothetical protein
MMFGLLGGLLHENKNKQQVKTHTESNFRIIFIGQPLK